MDFFWVLEQALNTSLHKELNKSLQLCIKKLLLNVELFHLGKTFYSQLLPILPEPSPKWHELIPLCVTLPPGETCACPSDVCGVHVFCDPGDAEDTGVDAAAAAASAGGRSSSSLPLIKTDRFSH